MTSKVTKPTITDLKSRVAAEVEAEFGKDPSQISVKEWSKNWVAERGVADGITCSLFAHEVEADIRYQACHPDLWGMRSLYIGHTGVGKSAGVEAAYHSVAETMGRELHLNIRHVSQLGPVDALGVPRERDGRTYWALPENWPITRLNPGHDEQVTAFLAEYHKTGKTEWELLPRKFFVEFQDEVTNPSAMSIVHQLFPVWLGNQIGNEPLVKDFAVVLAGNAQAHRTNSMDLSASAVTRLTVKEVIPHFFGWLIWAYKHRGSFDKDGQPEPNIHPFVVGYLARFTDQFAPGNKEIIGMQPFPNPRAWEEVSRYLYTHDRDPMPQNMLEANLAGRVGNAATRSIVAFMDYFAQLPDVNKIMAGHDVPLPTDRPDVLYMLGTNMIQKLKPDNAKHFMAYMLDEQKFTPEIACCTMRLLAPAGKLKIISQGPAANLFFAWAEKYENLIF